MTGPTQFYDRPTGRQYWAPVQVVPRVYIQHTGTDKPAIKQLQTKLSEAGFDVPAAEVIETAKGKRELRYFDKNDGPVAELLLQRLAGDSPTPDTAGQSRLPLFRRFARQQPVCAGNLDRSKGSASTRYGDLPVSPAAGSTSGLSRQLHGGDLCRPKSRAEAVY